jgi:hypothetical protein
MERDRAQTAHPAEMAVLAAAVARGSAPVERADSVVEEAANLTGIRITLVVLAAAEAAA